MTPAMTTAPNSMLRAPPGISIPVVGEPDKQQRSSYYFAAHFQLRPQRSQHQQPLQQQQQQQRQPRYVPPASRSGLRMRDHDNNTTNNMGHQSRFNFSNTTTALPLSLTTPPQSPSKGVVSVTAEVRASVDYIAQMVQDVVSSSEIYRLKIALTTTLTKHHEDHWHEDSPTKGSGYRCLVFTTSKMDPVIASAVRLAGVSVNAVSKSLLASELRVWIDPGDVSCKRGTGGRLQQLYPVTINSTNSTGTEPIVDTSLCAAARVFQPSPPSSPKSSGRVPATGIAIVAPSEHHRRYSIHNSLSLEKNQRAFNMFPDMEATFAY